MHEYMRVVRSEHFQENAALQGGDFIKIVRKPARGTDGFRQDKQAVGILEILASAQALHELQTGQNAGESVIELAWMTEMGTKDYAALALSLSLSLSLSLARSGLHQP